MPTVLNQRMVKRLKEFDSYVVVPLDNWAPGVYEQELLIEGNSILSTVFVSLLDVGASVLVEYFDTTTGQTEGEFFALNEHPLIASAGTTNRLTVTRIHNKPVMRATVVGGTVRFSTYITVVSSFASDLDAALQYEADLVDVARDKGIPVAAFETTTSAWSFLRTINGKLQVDVPGIIQTSQASINFRRHNITASAIPGTPYLHITYTVPLNKRLTWLSGHGTGNSWTTWTVTIDDIIYLSKTNSFDQQQVDLSLDNPLVITAGQKIDIEVVNLSPYNTNSAIETFFYGALEDV